MHLNANVASLNFMLLFLKAHVSQLQPQEMTSQTKRNKEPTNKIKNKHPDHALIFSFLDFLILLDDQETCNLNLDANLTRFDCRLVE